MRGKLIVFEGLDKAGKSTQCSRLVKNLQDEGHKIKYFRFPDRTTPIGKMIDAYLKGQSEQDDHVIHLLFSANRWEVGPAIEKDIADGFTVIIDRYYYSGCVYSAAKDNPSLSLGWARCPEVGLPRPDACVFLNISSQEAAKRSGYGEERYETSRMQTRVRELFGELLKGPERDDFIVIDADQSLTEVEQLVSAAVHQVFHRVDHDNIPLRKVEPW